MRVIANKKIFILISIIFVGYGFITGSSSVAVEGFVYDTSMKYIPFSRVEISNIQGEKSGSASAYYVAYSDKKGKWKLKIPFHKKIMIKVFSNGFIPNRTLIDMEIEKSLNNKKTIVRSQMLKGLKHIEWGSFEQSMLYVRTEDLKSIEELILSKEYEEADEFIINNVKDHSQKVAFLFAGHAAFRNGAAQESKEYFSKSGSKLWYNLMGRYNLRKGNFKESLEYYLKGTTTRVRAYDLMKLGEHFDKNQSLSLKNRSLLKAMDDFSMLIVDYRFKWSDDLLRMRYDSYNKLLSKEKNKNSKELKGLLIKAGEYCKKLKKAEIYYYCNEEKIDKVVLIKDLHDAIENPRKYFDKYKPPKLKGIKIRDKYLYDLQFVLDEKGVVEEARKLVHEYPDLKRNPVPVLSYKVVRPLYGPNTLIGFGWQDFFNYKIVGKEKLMNVETSIVDAFPKWSSFTNQMYGKLWVSNKDGSILKIEWKHQNLNRKDLRTRGLILNRIPGMTFISTYGTVRAGLRFPSQYRIIEHYSRDSDRFIRLDITGIYKDYTFFGVDIDDVKAE